MVEVLLVTYFIFDKNLSQAIVMAAGRSTQNVRTATNIEGHNRLELVQRNNHSRRIGLENGLIYVI